MALYEPKLFTTENKTCWTTGPALTRKAMSPIIIVVAPLKQDKILPAELSLSKDIFICLKVSSCNRSTARPGSTSTLCTSKLIHKVSTSASWCGVMTLDGFIGRKDVGSSIDWTTLFLSRTWMVFTCARIVATRNSLFF